jgi:16S rRNA (guanine966-N2)-methyltransferase
MRVIAGRLGGRRLSAPKGSSTRPTSDRVREALFSVLGDLTGASVLDLYAGTGALGIEALSRGARRALFVESARPALAVLRKNIEDLGLTAEAHAVAQPVARAIDRIAQEGPFDLILLDPPYAALAEAATVLNALMDRGSPGEGLAGPILAAGGTLVLEHASRDAPPSLKGLTRTSTRSYGEASLSFYEREEPTSPNP